MLCSREYQTIVSNVKFSIFSYRTYTHNLHSILVSRNIYPIYAKDPNFTILFHKFYTVHSILEFRSGEKIFLLRVILIFIDDHIWFILQWFIPVIWHGALCITASGNIRITWISWKIGGRKCAPVERLKIMIYSRFFLNTLNTKNLNCYSNDFYFK